MAGRIGLARRVGPRALSMVSRLLTQITERPWVSMERSFEQQMEEPPGSPKQAGLVTLSLRFHLLTPTLAQPLVRPA